MKLAAESNELPPSLNIYGVDIGTERDPCAMGGFADIFRGTYDGREVAVKRLRMSDVPKAKTHKVYDIQLSARIELNQRCSGFLSGSLGLAATSSPICSFIYWCGCANLLFNGESLHGFVMDVAGYNYPLHAKRGLQCRKRLPSTCTSRSGSIGISLTKLTLVLSCGKLLGA